MAATTYQIGTMGKGALLHLIDGEGPICDRPRDPSARWIDPEIVDGAPVATCRKCLRVAAKGA